MRFFRVLWYDWLRRESTPLELLGHELMLLGVRLWLRRAAGGRSWTREWSIVVEPTRTRR